MTSGKGKGMGKSPPPLPAGIRGPPSIPYLDLEVCFEWTSGMQLGDVGLSTLGIHQQIVITHVAHGSSVDICNKRQSCVPIAVGDYVLAVDDVDVTLEDAGEEWFLCTMKRLGNPEGVHTLKVRRMRWYMRMVRLGLRDTIIRGTSMSGEELFSFTPDPKSSGSLAILKDDIAKALNTSGIHNFKHITFFADECILEENDMVDDFDAILVRIVFDVRKVWPEVQGMRPSELTLHKQELDYIRQRFGMRAHAY